MPSVSQKNNSRIVSACHEHRCRLYGIYEHAHRYPDKYIHTYISEKLGVKVKCSGGQSQFAEWSITCESVLEETYGKQGDCSQLSIYDILNWWEMSRCIINSFYHCSGFTVCIFGPTTPLEWLSQRTGFPIKLWGSAQPRSRSEAPPHWFPCLGNICNPCPSSHAWDPWCGVSRFINHSVSTFAECLRARPKSHMLQMKRWRAQKGGRNNPVPADIWNLPPQKLSFFNAWLRALFQLGVCAIGYQLWCCGVCCDRVLPFPRPESPLSLLTVCQALQLECVKFSFEAVSFHHSCLFWSSMWNRFLLLL